MRVYHVYTNSAINGRGSDAQNLPARVTFTQHERVNVQATWGGSGRPDFASMTAQQINDLFGSLDFILLCAWMAVMTVIWIERNPL